MCGVPYAVNVERNKVMTYSYPFMYKYQSAVYKKPVDEERSWAVLTSCFKWEVYVCGLVAIFAVSVLFVCFEMANPGRNYPLRRTAELSLLGVMVPLHQGESQLAFRVTRLQEPREIILEISVDQL